MNNPPTITNMPAMCALFITFTIGFYMLSLPFKGRIGTALRTVSGACLCMTIMFGMAAAL